MEENSLAYRGMTAGNILDYTFQVYGRNFGTILCFSALVAGLFNLLNIWIVNVLSLPGMAVNPWAMILEFMETGDIKSFTMNSANTGYNDIEWLRRSFLFQGINGLLSLISSLFIFPIVQGGILGITHRYAQGTKLTVSGAFHLSFKKFWRMVVTSLCLGLYYLGIGIVIFAIAMIGIIPMIGMGFMIENNGSVISIAGFTVLLIFIALIILLVSLVAQMFVSFTYPVVVAEDVFHFNAMGRSFKLVGKKFWKVLGITFLITLITGIIMLVLGIVIFVLMMSTRNPLIAQLAFSFLSIALIMPIGYIASMVLYMDVRRQVEGSYQ